MKKWLLIFCLFIFASNCVTVPHYDSVFVPVGMAAKVNTEGEIFGLRPREVPFLDSATDVSLFLSARGVKDAPAIEAMVNSGRVIFLPTGTSVDVVEHDEKNSATKVRIRSGTNIGREMWTHPKFVSPIN